jgi:hypothetical protein
VLPAVGYLFSSYEKNRDVRGPYGADSRVFRKKKLQACAGWVISPGVAMKQCCGRRKGFGFATQSVVCKKNRFQGGHGSATLVFWLAGSLRHADVWVQTTAWPAFFETGQLLTN